ncbi:MAG TPA: Rrf2 family transcriptional regulator [Anaerolineales bacterium]|nr:Rrf2 family transcriptional regulator [Anaerolineales bacterium]
MQITRQADYAVRAVMYLSKLGTNARVSTAEIAREQSIPTTFLAKIVSQLASSGVVRATRGARGGVTLARPPEEISLLEIVEAIDGPMALNECVLDASRCPMSVECPVRPVWCDVQSTLARQLAQANFGLLVKHNGSIPLSTIGD